MFLLIFTFPKAWIWICFFSLKNDFYCSSSSAEQTKFESLIDLHILCCICCKRYQINSIQLGCISQLFLLLKTMVKMNRQAEHSLLFLKHFKGEKKIIRLWHWNTVLARKFIWKINHLETQQCKTPRSLTHKISNFLLSLLWSVGW